jgi:hypothetical protein
MKSADPTTRNRPAEMAGFKPEYYYRDMTEYFVKNTSKLLFPSLARDQRLRRMRIILLVVTTCLFSAGGLLMWMMSASSSHSLIWPDLSLWQQ